MGEHWLKHFQCKIPVPGECWCDLVLERRVSPLMALREGSPQTEVLSLPFRTSSVGFSSCVLFPQCGLWQISPGISENTAGQWVQLIKKPTHQKNKQIMVSQNSLGWQGPLKVVWPSPCHRWGPRPPDQAAPGPSARPGMFPQLFLPTSETFLSPSL